MVWSNDKKLVYPLLNYAIWGSDSHNSDVSDYVIAGDKNNCRNFGHEGSGVNC